MLEVPRLKTRRHDLVDILARGVLALLVEKKPEKTGPRTRMI
jgi:hypothetical protein